MKESGLSNPAKGRLGGWGRRGEVRGMGKVLQFVNAVINREEIYFHYIYGGQAKKY